MYTLIIFLLLQGRIQTIQIDGFSTKEKCEQSFYLMEPVFVKQNRDTGTQITPYCVIKD
jgi:hypothetical protein